MSLTKRQLTSSINDALSRLFRRGRIPSFADVFKEIRLPAQLGMPYFSAFKQTPRKVSSPDIFNQNLLDFMQDVKLLNEELIDQGVRIARQTDLSSIEFDKVISDVRDAKNDALQIILTKDFARGIGVYAYDDFTSLAHVDTTRTTATVDIETTTASLPIDEVRKIDMKHLLPKVSTQVQVLYRKDATLSQIDGTAFGNVFDDTYSMWAVEVSVPENEGDVTISFEVPLGNPESLDVTERFGREFNSFSFITLSSLSQSNDLAVEIAYKNGIATEYTTLPVVASAKNGAFTVYDIDLTSIAGWSQTSLQERHEKTHIRSLRFTMTKSTPDFNVAGRDIYVFSMVDLSLYRKIYKSRGSLYSNSLPIAGPPPKTLTKASLLAAQSAPANSSITWYMAQDRYLPMYFVDQGGEYVPPGSPDATGITEVTGWEDPHTSGIRQTDLRYWAEKVGAYTYDGTDYASWEPSWVKVVPADDQVGGMVGGDPGVSVVDFGNTSVAGRTSPVDWASPSSLPEVEYGGIDVYRVVNFYDQVLPGTIEVYQGKDSWIGSTENTFARRTVLVTSGVLSDDDTEPSYIAPGEIINGSVREVRSPGAEPEEYYDGEGASPDYYVKYYTDFLLIYRNIGTADDIIDLADDTIEFKVDIKEDVTIRKWKTYFYVPPGKDAGVTINMGGVSEAKVINRDEESNINIGEVLVGENGTVDFTQIGQGFGWFEVTINVNSDNWNPNVSVVKSGSLRQYAWNQPLRLVSSHDLLYRINIDDHTNCSVFYPDSNEFYVDDVGDSSVWLGVNDPTTPAEATGTDQDIYTYIRHATLASGYPLEAGYIFEDQDSISQFYDVTYTIVGSIVDNLLVRADMYTSNRTISPYIDGYAVRAIQF